MYNLLGRILILVVLISMSSVYAQDGPSGSETLVNTTTDNRQQYAAVDMDSVGNYIVAWESMVGGAIAIMAQRFNADGSANGSELTVRSIASSTSNESYSSPDVALSNNGDFVVCWIQYDTAGLDYELRFNAYDNTGASLTSNRYVDRSTTDALKRPRIAMDEDGDFVLLWMDPDADASGYGLFSKPYNSSFSALTSSVTVNETEDNYQGYPEIGMNASGDYIVVWQSDDQDGDGMGIYARKYDIGGSALTSEFKVNSTTTGHQIEPVAGMDANGNYIVAWASRDQDGDYEGIYAQRYNSSDVAQGSEFLVNTTTTGTQNHPAITVTEEGNFTISWSSYAEDGSYMGIYMQSYRADGSTYGTVPVRVNTRTADFQEFSTMAQYKDSTEMVVVWQDGLRNSTSTHDGSDYGIYMQRFNMQDTIPPNANCQNLTVYLDGFGANTISGADIDNGSTDNVGVVTTYLISDSSFDCTDLGSNSVILWVEDANQNSDACGATVTVLDTVSPSAVCSDIVVYLDSGGNGVLVDGDADGGSSDNCSIATYALSTTSFTCANLGVNSETLTVTDASGNSDSCTTTVTVMDSIPPTVSCLDITVALSVSGFHPIAGTDIEASSADNCGVSTLTPSIPIFDCTHTGTNTVTLTAADASGNTATCTATVTVLDTVPPAVTCTDITVQLDINGAATIVKTDVASSTDTCGLVNDSIDITTFSCANVGANTVTYYAWDINGDTSVCTSTVTIQDTIGPVVTCNDLTVHLSNTGNASIIASEIGSSVDSCGVATEVLDITSFTCANVGSNTVTFTATDVNGAVNTCSATVTVQDTVSPVVSCSDITVHLDNTGNVSVAATLVGSSTDTCGIATEVLDVSAYTCANVGSNTVTYTATDVNGNSTSCTASLTVQDTVAPFVTCSDLTVFLDGDGSGTIVPANIGSATDSCGIASQVLDISSFSCADVGTVPVMLTATDVNGNVSTCDANVIVRDTVAPVVSCSDITVQLDATGNAAITSSDLASATDSCGMATEVLDSTVFSCANVGSSLTVTFTATDIHGNVSNCTGTVTVQDTVSPVVVCNDLTVQLDGSGNATLVVSDVAASTDSCGIASEVLDVTTFSCANVGANTVTFTSTDVNGNVSSCTSTVTIEDTVPPVVTCNDLSVYLDATGNGSIVASDIGSSSDSCGVATEVVDISAFTCSEVGTNTVTFTSTDVNGNAASCTGFVVVQDTIDPVVNCSDITVQLDATGNAAIVVADLATATDSCGIASEILDVSTFTCANVGSNTVTLTATDANGNVSTCSGTVTIQDTVAPLISCSDITVQLSATGNASIVVADVASASDSCGIASNVLDITSFTCANVGSNTVTFTSTDVNGNVSTCTAAVTVQDTVAPLVSCSDLTVYLDNTGNTSITVADVASSTDTCGIATEVLDITSFTCANVGSNTVTFTSTDVNGNVSTCTSTVTVQDTVAPVVACTDITIQLDATGNATISVSDMATASDSCGIASEILDMTSFTCGNVGTNTVTLTATDNNGNVSTCSATVTVQDTVPPVVICTDITVQLDATGNASITTLDIGDSSDSCDVASEVVDITSFTCANVGSNTVTYTVTDINGNVASCTSTVTVQDTVAPLVSCTDITVQLDATGNAAITASTIGSSNDSCGIATTVLDISSFTCGEVGANTITYTATDNNGNVSTCTASVTVQDTIAPVVSCTDITVQLDNTGNATITVVDLATSSDSCGIASEEMDIVSFTCAEVGSNTVTFTSTDNNGNFSSCTSVVTVEDTVSPVVACSDITVQLDATGNASIVPADIGTSSDSCGIVGTLLDITSFDCSNVGANTVTYTAVDANANSTTCTSTVTVQDTVAPLVSCTDITVQLDATGNTSIIATDIGSATDSCGIANQVLDITDFTCAEVGSNTVTYTATDVNGVSTACTATVTVQDTVSPVVSCSDITVQLDATGNASIVVADMATSTDSCGIASEVLDITAFTCGNVGSNTVTFTATDINGNVSTCSANVTIQDTVAPVVACTDITVQLDNTGNVSLVPSDLGISSDSCGVAGEVLDITALNCANIGGNTVTFSSTDLNGNTASCTATVTVQDTVAPVVSCTDITVQLDNTGNTSIVPADLGTSSDSCGIASTVLDINSFTCAEVGGNTVVYTATDVNGNVSTCSATVTVQDTVAPVVSCTDITVQLDNTGNASITVPDLAASSDSCGIASEVLDITAFTCSDVGSNTVTFTATDVNGNVSNCTATVTIQDTVAPVVSCTDITVQLDNTGNTSITVADMASSSDSCGIASEVLDITAFTCGEVGGNTVTFTATDVNGNVSTCTAVVTVQDTVAPVVSCTDITVQLDNTGNTSITVADMAASSDSCGIASEVLDLTAFTCAEVGGNTVTFTATDVNGNVSTCTSTVTVEDTVAPVVACTDITVQLDNTGNTSIVVADMASSSDSCGIASEVLDITAFTCANVGANTVTFTSTDVNGNVSTCTSTVTVEDTVAPVVACTDITVQLDNTGNTSITVADLATASDSCGIASEVLDIMSFTCVDVGSNTVTYTATDVNGNVSTCTAVVTVQDTVAPVVGCTDITVQLDNTGNTSIVASDIGISSDSCGIASEVLDITAFTCGEVGGNTVTFTATDVNGNSTSCTATVMVEDTVAPVVNCTDITVQLDNTGNASITVPDMASSSDSCGIASEVLDITSFTCGEVGANTVTFTSTDVNGNISTCTATVTIQDTVAPVVVCTDITVQLDATGNAAIVVADLASSSDSCGIASEVLDITTFTCADVGGNTVTFTSTDVNGNVSSCTATVTLQDTVAPVVSCTDITVQLDSSGNASIVTTDMATASDSCGIASEVLDITTFTCAEVGANTVTYTATDVNGNVSICSSTVTIQDTVTPVITCTDITIQLDSAGNASITVADMATSTDACGIASEVLDLTAFTCSEVGSNTVTFTATDVNSNISICTATVTVMDTVAPVVACADLTIQLDSSGNTSIIPADIGSSTDACTIDTTLLDVYDFSCADIGANTVTYTAIDVNGNVSQCSAEVTVMDTVAPVVVCTDLTVQLDSAGTVSIVPSDIGVSSDSCGIASTVLDTFNFACANFGPNTVTYTVTDVNGNVSACSATVTVQDLIAPVVTCTDYTLELDSSGNATLFAFNIGTAADACGIASDTIDVSDFTCADIGPNTVTYYALDGNGNLSLCTATVTVSDTVAPVVICTDITIQLDTTGNASITIADVGASADSCGVLSDSIDVSSFTCLDAGINLVTYSAIDVNGNVASCIANVTVEDTVAPEALCQPHFIQLDSIGWSPLAYADIDNGSNDNCGIDTFWMSLDSFSCAEVGVHDIVLTVADSYGNLDSCTATVTVDDTLGITFRPIDLGPDTTICYSYTLLLDAGQGFISYAWYDADSMVLDSVQTYLADSSGWYGVEVLDSFGCFGNGSIEIFEASPPDSLIQVFGNETLCLDDTATLEALPGYLTYLWNTGETSENIVVDATFLYGVTVTDSVCAYRDTVSVTFEPFPNPVITIIPGPTVEICAGEEITLGIDEGLFSIVWNTGETGQFIDVSTPGSFAVTAENGFGCIGHSDTVTVDTLPLPIVTISLSSDGDTMFANPTGSSYQWYELDEPIPGATGAFYEPGNSSQFGVAVTDANGCTGFSDPYDFVVVGQEAGIPDGSIEVYPNPATDRINITANHFNFGSTPDVRLYNALGQEINAIMVESTPAQVILDLSVVSNGIYFVKVKANGKEMVEKVLKSAR